MAQKGHLGQDPPNKRVGPKPMMRARRQRDPPRPKTKIEAWGLRIWELATQANDGRIWPGAIIGQGSVIWPKGHRAPEGAQLAIKIWCGHLAPAWSQARVIATPIEEGHYLCSITVQFKCSATEPFNYDSKADLRNGLTQAHAVFTCHTAAQPFVHTLSPGHKAEHKKGSFVFQPFQPRGQRSPQPRHPCEDSFVVDDDESIPELEWTPAPQTGIREQLWTIIPVPSSINLSTPPPRPPTNGHFTPPQEQSDYPADEGWQWQEDIQAWANCHHVL
ncbi:hypothetical protein O181_108204 [Austropuccinia psidii MF-1]|uniref:Uncharacterized protein n=1 Tax=Austropuccinia psidii MF-1 TaxID=1389203 RepID=A0A9Q3PNR2_9BASI|nr:hypothetical protein [Austropuccinia psidii MF-1]